ncbi:MAG: hypothetical protein M3T55_04275 [Pseudomonadota bacterium]|nr:hypothetical protein [Pseudomonadota bacterium]
MADHIFMAEVVQPVLIKDGGLFLVCRGDGEITAECGSGFGLFHRDTRYLSRYELRIGGAATLTLMSSAARGVQSVHDLTNDVVQQLDGTPLDVQSLGARLDRTVDGESLVLTDRLVVRNFTADKIAFRVSILIDALFEDLFELRGAKGAKRGPTRKVTVSDRGLAFRYRGADKTTRELEVAFSRPATFRARRGARVVEFDFALESQASEALTVTFTVHEAGAPRAAPPPEPAFYDGVKIESDDAILDAVADRSFRDLAMLRTGLADNFIAGGMPWFVSAFGRDSLLAALQTLAFDPRPAEGVARLFALHQGKRHDRETGEQPGKIHHELRLGAMARLGEVPHRPSYTSVDSTPLYLILIGEHARWTGSLDLFRELRGAIDAALAWMDGDGDSNGDGYLDYTGKTPEGPINQGWKDSTFGVPRHDGGVPKSPIALCEVQGYAYLAKTLIAKALRADGDKAAAARLEAQAKALGERFNRDFWMEDEGCYALALEKGGRQVSVVTSNAGQVLWSGIAEPAKAVRVADRLMAADMNCGWGIRTLSERAAAYNPLNYHLGCVWPFDNALIVAGLRRYGLDEAAGRIFRAVVDAAGHFGLGRLPEFYVGFAREAGLFPARCPFAEPLQAWSAGATPYMLASLLGLERVDEGVRMERPLLPPGVDRLALRGLTLGNARIDCELERGADGAVSGRMVTAREMER